MHYVNQCGSKKLLLVSQMWTWQYSRAADLIRACTLGWQNEIMQRYV